MKHTSDYMGGQVAVVEGLGNKSREEQTDNARLLAAAYNAFDSAAKILGLNAVEMAERMEDGVLLAELLDNADCILHHTSYLAKLLSYR